MKKSKVRPRPQPKDPAPGAPRPAIYPGKIKDTAHRVQGWLTETGRHSFEAVRQQLQRKHPDIQRVSHADTIEFLAREYTKPGIERK